MMSFITNYILLFLFFSGFILVDMGMTLVNIMIDEKVNEDENKAEEEKMRMVRMERQRRSFKLTTYKHKGFDFDGAAGHDVLITDSIFKRLQ